MRGWNWLTRLKKNRLVNPDNTKNIQIQDVKIPSEGIIVHLKAYGFIKVFKIVTDDDDIGYWATDLLEMDEYNHETMGKYSGRLRNIIVELSSSVGSRGVKQEMVYPKRRT